VFRDYERIIQSVQRNGESSRRIYINGLYNLIHYNLAQVHTVVGGDLIPR